MERKYPTWAVAVAVAVGVVACDGGANLPATPEASLEIVLHDGHATWNQEGLDRIMEGGVDDVPVRVQIKRADGTVLTDVRANSFTEALPIIRKRATVAGQTWGLPPDLEGFDSWPEARQAETLEAMQGRIDVLRERIGEYEARYEARREGGSE